MGQSRISTHLAQLRRAGLVENQRDGRHSIYAARVPDGGERLAEAAQEAAAELPEREADHRAARHALDRRRNRMRAYIDKLAGRFGRDYVPGRSWKSLAEALLKILPPVVVADLGAGEGTVSQLFAQRARKVIAVDNSEKMVDYGAKLAHDNGMKNLEYRLGDMEAAPIDDASVDIALFSQALHHADNPDRALAEAFRILKPGGRLVVLDLLRHRFERAREIYADVWLGFPEVELTRMIEGARFHEVECVVVDREEGKPGFETLLALGTRPGRVAAKTRTARRRPAP